MRHRAEIRKDRAVSYSTAGPFLVRYGVSLQVWVFFIMLHNATFFFFATICYIYSLFICINYYIIRFWNKLREI